MIFQAFFDSAQTGLGYQFYDNSGTLLGARVTAGIITLPGVGAYAADATPPATASGIYWDSNESEAHEDLREALALEALTPAAIASQTRTELTTELVRIDAPISTRNATAPDNAGIAAVKAKTDNLPASPASVSDVPTAAATRAEIDANSTQLVALLNAIAALNNYDGSDTTGTTTLLTRLTATRAGFLDNLDAEISSRLAAAGYTAPLGATATQTAAAAALTAYDPPTRAEATADKAEIIARGDIAWVTGAGGAGGSGLSAEALEALEGADQVLLAELHNPTVAPSTPHVMIPADDDSDTIPTISLTC